jgi:cell division cycle protein 37
VLVHPNVDKKSFIRWKQRDIHEKRAQRKQDIQNLKLSNEINHTLQLHIDDIIGRLEKGQSTLDEGNIANAFRPDVEKLGDAPTGSDGPSYAQMVSSLFEDIRKTVAADGDKKMAYIRELGVHRKKIRDEIVKNEAEVAKLEKEEKSKITSEGLHEGFSSSVLHHSLRRSGLLLACREAEYETTCRWDQGP